MLTRTSCLEVKEREISNRLCEISNEILQIRLYYNLLIAANSDSGLEQEDEVNRLSFLIGQFCSEFDLKRISDLQDKVDESNEIFQSLMKEIN